MKTWKSLKSRTEGHLGHPRCCIVDNQNSLFECVLTFAQEVRNTRARFWGKLHGSTWQDSCCRNVITFLVTAQTPCLIDILSLWNQGFWWPSISRWSIGFGHSCQPNFRTWKTTGLALGIAWCQISMHRKWNLLSCGLSRLQGWRFATSLQDTRWTLKQNVWKALRGQVSWQKSSGFVTLVATQTWRLFLCGIYRFLLLC